MTAQEFTTLARILEQIATHHDQDARKCPGPANCPLAAAINDLGLLLANTTKIESGFDDPASPVLECTCNYETAKRYDCPRHGIKTAEKMTLEPASEAGYGPDMRVEDLPPAATLPPNDQPAQEITAEFAQQWFTKNLPWLKGWLNCFEDAPYGERDQVFYRSQPCYIDRRGSLDERIRETIKAVNDEFVTMALFTLIFGIQTTHMELEECPRYTIAGFYAQAGRLPTKDDHVRIHAAEHGDIEQREGMLEITVYRRWRISRLEILPPEPDPQASPDTLAAISNARDYADEEPVVDSDTAHAILRAQGRLP